MTLRRDLVDVVDFLGGRMADARTPGAAAAAVSAQRSSSAIAMYVAGLIKDRDLTDYLAILGYTGDRSRRLVDSAALDRRRAIAELKHDVLVEQLKDGVLDRNTLAARLFEVGFDHEIAGLRAELAWRRIPVKEGALAKTSIGLILLVRQSDAREATRTTTAAAVRPGGQLEAQITLVNQETGAGIPNVNYQLQIFDERIGDYVERSKAVANADGVAGFPFPAPAIAGFYRYRARFPGAPGLRPDTSPVRNVEVIQ